MERLMAALPALAVRSCRPCAGRLRCVDAKCRSVAPAFADGMAGRCPAVTCVPASKCLRASCPCRTFSLPEPGLCGVPRGFPRFVCPGRVSGLRLCGPPVRVPGSRLGPFAPPAFLRRGCCARPGGAPSVPRYPGLPAAACPCFVCCRFAVPAVAGCREFVPAACACPAAVLPGSARVVLVRVVSARRLAPCRGFVLRAFAGCLGRVSAPRNPGRAPVR